MSAGNRARRRRMRPAAPPRKTRPERCAATGKIGYPTSLAAENNLRWTKRKGRDEKRAYLCTRCHNWHLTSKPKSPNSIQEGRDG